MKSRGSFAVAFAVGALSALGALAACGSRTGLPEDDVTGDAADELSFGPDGSADGPFEPDRFARGDVHHGFDVVVDRPDVLDVLDAAEDRRRDAVDELPLIDTKPQDVIILTNCPDAAATLIYVIGDTTNTLYSFNPASDTFSSIGVITCPGAGGATPFSMAVDQEGVAYVVLTSGQLYRVSTKTAECTATTYKPAAHHDETFGMGFVANVTDGGEGGPAGDTLYVAGDTSGIYGNGELATIDTTSFALKNVGFFGPTPIDGAELTGTGDGRLFAFSPSASAGGSFLAQIDPLTATIIAQDPLPGIKRGSGWAFGFWGGAFYLFTAPGGGTQVNRFDPVTGLDPVVATLSDVIVGAGVSTCAPVN